MVNIESSLAENTLPDYLKPGLRLLFIGINPGTYSAHVGHYFARPGNLFWWALSNSRLVPRPVEPTDDAALLEWGIGLTDVVKRPTNSSGDLRQDEFDVGAKAIVQTLETYQPGVACFVGILGATAFVGRQVKPGPLTEKIGATRLFAIPSPSRRNAHYGREGILNYFKQLAGFVGGTTTPTVSV
ncbi:MAG: mismatch-specific DNA-glycosylase [Elusimicrobiota bacterium]|jgi:TDG/mug DNA glycosylase family protein